MAKKYKRNFLKQVLVRVDFQRALADYEKGLYPKAEKIISKTFPIPVEFKRKQQSFEANSMGQFKANLIEQPLWTYYSRSKQKLTRIEPTDFYIQYDKYNSFDTLKKDFRLIFDSLISNYGELNITRIGLRYIDEIKIKRKENVFDWKGYLNPKLFSILSMPDKKDRNFISRAFSNLEFNFGDHNLTLKYGMFNPDHPSPIKKKVFVIDSDAYKRDNIKDAEACNTLDVLHDKISNMFENKLIMDKLRELMNG
jgi:uncharacterized protein (TIGR04255 family)